MCFLPNSSSVIVFVSFAVIFIYECFFAIADGTLSVGVGLFIWYFKNYSKPPMVDLKYFGPENQSIDYDDSIKPFKIDIPESVSIVNVNILCAHQRTFSYHSILSMNVFMPKWANCEKSFIAFLIGDFKEQIF